MPLVESHHWWDDPEYDDIVGEEGEEGEDAFEDLRNPSVTTARREFAEMLVQMRMSSRLTAKEVCVLVFWAKRSTGEVPAAELAKHPFLKPTGHYQEHFDEALGFKESIGNQGTLRFLDIRYLPPVGSAWT